MQFCRRRFQSKCLIDPMSLPCVLIDLKWLPHVLFVSPELNQTAKTFFPKEYLSRKQTFQKANYAKWPLPHCPKRFRIFWGLYNLIWSIVASLCLGSWPRWVRCCLAQLFWSLESDKHFGPLKVPLWNALTILWRATFTPFKFLLWICQKFYVCFFGSLYL